MRTVCCQHFERRRLRVSNLVKMSASPESLSKEKLKSELKKRGVTFYQSENKAYYVDLYRSEVIGERGFSRATRSDANKKSAAGSSAKQKQAMLLQLPQVEMMSDTKLRAKLSNYGENPGPIMDTTRATYQRRLAKLMNEPASPSRSVPSRKVLKTVGRTPTPELDEESFVEEAEYSDDESGKNFFSTLYHSRKRVQGDASLTKRVVPLSRRETSAKEVRPSVSASSRKIRGKQAPSACQVVRNLMLLLVVVAVIFLVYDYSTAPVSKQSLVARGYEMVRWRVASLYSPFMEYQRLQEEPVASRREETPSVEENSKVETEKTPDKKPPVNAPPKDSDPTPAKQPPGEARLPRNDAAPSHQPPEEGTPGTPSA